MSGRTSAATQNERAHARGPQAEQNTPHPRARSRPDLPLKRFQHIVTRALVHEGHHKPQLVARRETTEERKHVGVLAQFHGRHLRAHVVERRGDAVELDDLRGSESAPRVRARRRARAARSVTHEPTRGSRGAPARARLRARTFSATRFVNAGQSPMKTSANAPLPMRGPFTNDSGARGHRGSVAGEAMRAERSVNHSICSMESLKSDRVNGVNP